jgi:antitoxin (DNA-binding transcriptional repressor) of toxin-antitoxin stability system
MKRVPVAELKDQLSKYLRLVKRGEILEILEHGLPVARVERVERSASTDDEWIERLEREGMLTRARCKLPRAFLRSQPVPCTGDAAAAMRADREGR